MRHFDSQPFASDTRNNSAEKALLSIDNLPQQEPKLLINSPRTLYACKLEGILPKDLLYRPMQSFKNAKEKVSEEVVKLRYEYFENKRLELIEAVKRQRKAIIEKLSLANAQNNLDDAHLTALSSTVGRVGMKLRKSSLQLIQGIQQMEENLNSTANIQKRSVFGNQSIKVGLSTSRSQVDMIQGSRLNPFFSSQIDQAVQKDREKFQKQMQIYERTKQKEAKMVEKLLKNEEAKNFKIEENQLKFEELFQKEKFREFLIQKKLKEDQERKVHEEIQRSKEETQKEKVEKKQSWLKFLEKLQLQRTIEKEQELKLKLRKELVQAKEQQRQHKFQLCQEKNQLLLEVNRQKIELMSFKHQQLMEKLEERKQQLRHLTLEKKQEKEQLKERTLENLRRQEYEREMEWLEKQEEERLKELRIKLERERQAASQQLRVESQNRKIRETLVLSEQKEAERKDRLVRRQEEASERLERQRDRQRQEETVKKEVFSLKAMGKEFNRDRAMRKREFLMEQLQNKLGQDQQRYQAMVEERNYMKNVRVQTLVESEIQREHIKNALYQMSVWNTFDPKIINHIIGKEKYQPGQGIGGGDLTVDEIVRQTAISQQRRRKINKGLFSSSVGFQSMNGITQASTTGGFLTDRKPMNHMDDISELKEYSQMGQSYTNGFLSDRNTNNKFYQQTETNQREISPVPSNDGQSEFMITQKRVIETKANNKEETQPTAQDTQQETSHYNMTNDQSFSGLHYEVKFDRRQQNKPPSNQAESQAQSVIDSERLDGPQFESQVHDQAQMHQHQQDTDE